MSSHPDADAFVAAILRDPAEVTTRLVFADWLEETGDPSNAAWARFIRVHVELADCPPGVRREDLITQTYDEARHLRTRLTIRAATFVGHHETLPQLLPLERLTVRLAGFRPNPSVAALFQRRLALDYRVFPLAYQNDAIYVAIGNLRDVEPSLVDLRNLFGVREVVGVLSPAPDIGTALRTYRSPYQEARSSALFGLSPPGPFDGLIE